jgi:hypothetical protein
MRPSVLTRTLALCPFALLAWGRPGHAADSEPTRWRVSAGLLDEAVQAHLPALVRLPPPSGEPSAQNRPTLASLTELKYCGTNDKGRGRFRALLRLHGLNGPGQPLLGKSGCESSLAEQAKRLGETGEEADTVVADVEATWRAWELRLAVVRAEGASRTAKSRLATALEKRRELLVIPTADARIETDGGPLPLYTVPAFLPTAVELAVVLGESGAPTSPEKLALPSRSLSVAGEANSAAEMPLAFANQLLRRLTGAAPLVVSVNGEEVALRNVSLAAEGAGESLRVALHGTASPASLQATVRWTVTTGGDPLRFQQVQIVPVGEDCAGLGLVGAVGCKARNGALATAAATLAASLTERFAEAPIHQLVSPQTFRFTVAGERVRLTADLLRLSCASRALSANGRLAAPP